MDLPELSQSTNEMKVWGTTTPKAVSPLYEAHELWIVKGGYCSIHRHVTKDNLFLGLLGTLTVKVFDSDANGRPILGRFRTELVAPERQPLMVSAGEWHQFVNYSGDEVVALELYYPTAGRLSVESPDIERYSEGGLLSEDDNE